MDEPPLPLVLVADDDPLVRSFVVRSLRIIGYDTVDVRSGEDAVEAFSGQSREVTAVVLDLEMPGRGGLFAGDTIRAKTPRVPILYMSGTDARAAIGRRLELPNTGFLEKPCTIDELKTHLGRVIANG